ncbi:phosphoribosylformylglycinamidine synthase, purS protein [Methanothermobacter thermautotrophicus]|jgi:phosphoribosylformylglycinamidine synthase|uniref:Phosphoribosylformylglycinamidine synthase subunit PurS n=3 Tax=Methanothermobacter TaxID=145260 RepID=PURS_METTH|nr:MULTISPECIES: phosphoribosylformylglycinamidine synthase subunit PurS [Methanothermobacter]O26271.1 RecName: Full=Phosphoribosylformylglycinamidine synthase subunit PurS; Short=FGAM synthase; AltName: Full=Formylglycinamide ribonucleotide amidotransferase subunit III; Short=FGAR amidotransferase III; Short=FGAR-AT III; AltName: Full=Phosphoribosylformylglycinamidine synthase subunit III [Methanothermobacter thermautotrophicus str. Delta H]MBC7111147.1 phosphoribosylformylglycinamidine synthase
MKFMVEVRIRLKKGMLNPEAATIERALALLGYEVEDTDTTDVITFTMDEDSLEAVEREVEDMCQRLLCNPVIHDYDVSINEMEG